MFNQITSDIDASVVLAYDLPPTIKAGSVPLGFCSTQCARQPINYVTFKSARILTMFKKEGLKFSLATILIVFLSICSSVYPNSILIIIKFSNEVRTS